VRKIIVTTLAALALFALVSGDALACGASEASTKSACSAAKTTAKLAASKEAPSTGARACCPYAKICCPHSKGAFGEVQLTSEEHARLCKSHGKCEFTAVSVKGMTGSECERSVSAALTEVPGVLKVLKVSYQDGLAEICFDPNKTTGETLTTAVANKGYKAEIVPAVAKSSDSKGCSMLTCAKSGCCMLSKTKDQSKDKGTH